MSHSSDAPPQRRYPLVIEPAPSELDLLARASRDRELIESQLVRHGAILFRGFAMETVEQFHQFVEATSSGLLEYKERSSPRSQVSGRIYTSTDYPPDLPIFLHNEQSYNRVFPRKILFFCLLPPAEGGATPIADSRRVHDSIPAEIRDKFERLGYTYVRNFGTGFGLSWQEAFQTADRAAVEAYCGEHAIDWEWREGGKLRTRQVRPAIALHPRSGERTWFNHLTFFHVSTLDSAVREALLGELDEEDLPSNTYYGDGSPIEPEVLETLRTVYRQETVALPWRRGDLLMLDNMLSAHGREAYEGARKIVVGMADPVSWDQVTARALSA
jgi:alpha-ketoglutarate-dependent taurine dioxygenase